MTNYRLTAIAKHLQVETTQITRIDEWATVYFVVIKGLGGRFVSKRVCDRRQVVARVFSIIEGRKVDAKEVQTLEVRNEQVHVQLSGQLTYCGLEYFRSLVQQVA